MSIGVVSLMSLFPISTLRALQATNLTNATILRYNYEGLSAAVPDLGDGTRAWKPGLTVVPGSVIVPTNPAIREAFPQIVMFASANGITGAAEPNWLGAGPYNDGGVVWSPRTTPIYVIDPLGTFDFDFDTTGPEVSRSLFGNIRNATGVNASIDYCPRLTGLRGDLATSRDNARRLCTQPDSWVRLDESSGVSAFTANTVTLADLNEVYGNVYSPTVPMRLTLFDADGRVSHTREVSIPPSGSTAAQILTWTVPLPAGFVPSRVRIDTQEQRYTFLISCRRANRTVQRDVVVFFRRQFNPQDEMLYPAVFAPGLDAGDDRQPGFAGLDDDGDGTVDNASELGIPGSDDQPINYAVVRYRLPDASDPSRPAPFLKAGSFVCDFANLRWYRILKISDPVTAPDTLRPNNFSPVFSSFVQLTQDPQPEDRFVRLTLQDTDEDGVDQIIDSNSTAAIPVAARGAMFPRNVVEVYQISPFFISKVAAD